MFRLQQRVSVPAQRVVAGRAASVAPVAALALSRAASSTATASSSAASGRSWAFAAAAAAGVAAGAAAASNTERSSPVIVAHAATEDLKAVREAIVAAMEAPESYDDGSYGPLFVRLAWHASGTFDAKSGTGGSDGATMRYAPESTDGANAGLALARGLLDKVHEKFPQMSKADLWILAGTVAIEEMGGPSMPFREGRTDASDDSNVPPNGRLPDAALGNDHLRAVFHRQGFSDSEIVALSGAHALGRCHTDRSGFSGPWTNSPTAFSNDYFVQLLEQTWVKKNWNGPDQFVDKATGSLMMLPTDLALLDDDVFRPVVEKFAKDEDAFFAEFTRAWVKLTENGVKSFQKKGWFGLW